MGLAKYGPAGLLPFGLKSNGLAPQGSPFRCGRCVRRIGLRNLLVSYFVHKYTTRATRA